MGPSDAHGKGHSLHRRARHLHSEEKIAVRSEDDFHLKVDSSFECITCALAKTADAVEALLKH